MCGRYTITADPKQLAERFDAQLPPADSLQPRFNAAPSQDLPTLLNGDTDRVIQMLHWGLIPHWSKEPKTNYSMINARAETLESKPIFKQALEKRRCLVLADSFYEWQKLGKDKTPMRIMLKSAEPFAFAGLWETWKDPDGGMLCSFTIVTTTPNDLTAPIHNRMPVILLPENEEIWLDNKAGMEAWTSLLQPYPADLMRAYPVSSQVNSPANDNPQVAQPASAAS